MERDGLLGLERLAASGTYWFGSEDSALADALLAIKRYRTDKESAGYVNAAYRQHLQWEWEQAVTRCLEANPVTFGKREVAKRRMEAKCRRNPAMRPPGWRLP